VGGDYYDFVRIGNHSLGVVVGDVSGKGTQAAFFMTLTKGFLKALAGGSHSPAHVLTEANRLFCENVERGTFISMVYGVFETAEHTLKLARAGHNPVITRKSAGGSPEVLHPTGLALGLEGGELFGRSIQEVTVRYAPGDIFVFYTDGFTEAMNGSNEEFGQARLSQSVEAHSGGVAREIMEGVFSDVDAFAKKVKPHDDMTIVVVKVM
jgi:serine phosphatase RsbU (regulator of sigma subunit)